MKSLSTSITIDAPAGEVWRHLVDFESHADWNPIFASITGEPTVGTQLVAVARKNFDPTDPATSMTFRPEVLIAEPGVELRWAGKLAFGGLFDGTHYFRLEESDGVTVLEHGEDFKGILIVQRGAEGASRGRLIGQTKMRGPKRETRPMLATPTARAAAIPTRRGLTPRPFNWDIEVPRPTPAIAVARVYSAHVLIQWVRSPQASAPRSPKAWPPESTAASPITRSRSRTSTRPSGAERHIHWPAGAGYGWGFEPVVASASILRRSSPPRKEGWFRAFGFGWVLDSVDARREGG